MKLHRQVADRPLLEVPCSLHSVINTVRKLLKCRIY